MGVRIAFDDFGTGYSSLRHLSQLPVDVIKLDRTFVSALNRTDARRDRAILIAVDRRRRASSASASIAEGVEDAAQLAELQRAGCDYAQGYLFAEARPAGPAGARRHRPRPSRSSRTIGSAAQPRAGAALDAGACARRAARRGRTRRSELGWSGCASS